VQVDPQQFDLGRLSARADQACKERRLTMAAMAREVGVAASTIRRYRTATDAEADGVLALIGWLGAPPEEFINDSSVDGIPLPPAGTGNIRVDMGLLVKAESGRGTAARRTTIQRLAGAAQASGRTVASLTRWSAF